MLVAVTIAVVAVAIHIVVAIHVVDVAIPGQPACALPVSHPVSQADAARWLPLSPLFLQWLHLRQNPCFGFPSGVALAVSAGLYSTLCYITGYHRLATIAHNAYHAQWNWQVNNTQIKVLYTVSSRSNSVSRHSLLSLFGHCRAVRSHCSPKKLLLSWQHPSLVYNCTSSLYK